MAIDKALVVIRSGAMVFAALVVTVLALPSPTLSSAWTPARAPNLEGPLAPNERLLRADRLAVGALVGPESLAVDAQGRVYTGTMDGRIVRVDPGGDVIDVAHTDGRPFGIALAPDGSLIVADATRGILRVTPGAGTPPEVLAHEVAGELMLFVNGVDVAQDGAIYFTDSSTKWGYGSYGYEIIEQTQSGRVLHLDPKTRQVTVLARGLSFPNGLTLAEDESHLLFTETARYRVMRLWLTGDKEGEVEPVVENLPGLPDGISRSPRGTYWIALHSTRMPLLDLLHPYPFWKDVFSSLPRAVRPTHAETGLVVEVDASGKPLNSLHDSTGKRFQGATSAIERDGYVYVGTLMGTAIARVGL